MLKTLLIIIFFIGCTESVFSCDCTRGAIDYNKADVVFKGKVVDIFKIENVANIVNDPVYKVTLKVYKRQKGKISSKRVIIYTPGLCDTCCGIYFEKDGIYRVYAYKSENILIAELCSETIKLREYKFINWHRW